MNQTTTPKRFAREVGRLGVLGLIASGFSSCGSSPKPDPEALKRAESQAHAARAAYHRNQNALAYAPIVTPEPVQAPNEIRYFQVPVDSYVNEDGLLIDDHQLTLEIIQP